ncbi:hypothetical protein ACFLR1_04325 [Bacteroidota bacterium]
MKHQPTLFTLLILNVLLLVGSANEQCWQATGPSEFDQASLAQAENTNIALDGSGNPYVAYKDYGNSGKATVTEGEILTLNVNLVAEAPAP